MWIFKIVPCTGFHGAPRPAKFRDNRGWGKVFSSVLGVLKYRHRCSHRSVDRLQQIRCGQPHHRYTQSLKRFQIFYSVSKRGRLKVESRRKSRPNFALLTPHKNLGRVRRCLREQSKYLLWSNLWNRYIHLRRTYVGRPKQYGTTSRYIRQFHEMFGMADFNKCLRQSWGKYCTVMLSETVNCLVHRACRTAQLTCNRVTELRARPDHQNITILISNIYQIGKSLVQTTQCEVFYNKLWYTGLC